MSNRTTEDIIGALYDMVQDARAVPLAMDKCILERDKVGYAGRDHCPAAC